MEWSTGQEVASTPYQPGQGTAGITGHCVLVLRPRSSACTTLCHLTPAPETTRHGESGPGHHSLGISVRDQLFPPSLGHLHQGLGSLGIHVCRDPHDGSASALTEPRLLAQSIHSDPHTDRHVRFEVTLELPRRIGSDVTGASHQYFKDGTTPSPTPPQ